jgi:membrane protease YdiL (CAAX protease family)
MPVFKMDIETIRLAVMDTDNPANAQLLKVSNLFINFGAWVASSYIFIRIKRYDAGITWQTGLPKPGLLLLVLPVVSLALLFISSILINFNASLPIPEAIKSLSSETNRKLLENMLRMDNTNQLIVNLLAIGLAPALFEEIFFRGTLQRLLIHLFGNAHAGVWATSFIFAAIHMNVMQFIPMLFLALVLGYVCHYTKSIWPSVMLHFLNNATAVLVNYYGDNVPMAAQLAEDSYNPPILITLLSFLLVGGFIYWINNNYKKQEAINNE